jgi:polar amino acid transport system permease protein
MWMTLAAIQFDWGLFANRLFDPSSAFWLALATTIGVAVVAQVMGTLFGFMAVMASRSVKPLQILSYSYIMLFRGTPIIVQIFFVFFGANLFLGFTLFPREVSLIGLHVQGAVLAGTTALAVNEGAYMSEIIRAGLDAVDRGQMEAAQSVGMTRRMGMRRIVLPQAARTIVPPLGNQFNSMLKTTSLLAFIGVSEIFQDAQVTYAANFQPVEVLAAVAVWYLALTMIWTLVQVQIERRLGAADIEEGEPWTKRFLGIGSGGAYASR